MRLTEFAEQTVVIAKDQPQYRPMPAHRYAGDRTGRIVCCWSLTWRERLVVLVLGRVWHEVLTFNAPLQPQLLLVDKPAMQRAGDANRLVLRINGRRFPNRLLRLNPLNGKLRFAPLGKVVAHVMGRVPGSDQLTTIVYPGRGQS